MLLGPSVLERRAISRWQMMSCTMSHRWLAPLLLAIGLILMPSRAIAETITVTTVNDVSNDGDGLCSLREAIVSANTDAAIGGCSAGDGDDTIVFSPALPAPATFVLTHTGANEDNAMTGDLDVAGTLAIHGAGTDDTIIDGHHADRVFQILPGVRAAISGVTIRNGDPGTGADGGGIVVDLTARLTLTNTSVISNTAAHGGGVKVLGGLTLSECSVTGNQGGGVLNDGGLLLFRDARIAGNSGGYGVFNQSGGNLSFDGGIVDNNQGGGIYNTASTATLNRVSITGNTLGGGVCSVGTTLTRLALFDSTVTRNSATSGGGVFSGGIGAKADIRRTRIGENVATSAGGGVCNTGMMTLEASTIDQNRARSGGGIDHFGASLSLTNVTISANVATDNGGGLHNRSNSVLANVTFWANTASGPEAGSSIFNDEAELSIRNSIVARSDMQANCFNSGGIIHSLGHNLENADTCGLDATGDMVDTDPLLGPLQDNGGSTPTHALLLGSPAIDKGDESSCPGTDQRGYPRPQGLACDIGAYEVGAMADLSVGLVRLGTGTVAAGERITCTAAVTNVGPAAPVAVSVKYTWSPTQAVVGVEAPGCSVNLSGGVITCSHTGLGLGTVLVPDPHVVFATSAAFSGVLTHVAVVDPMEGVTDGHLADNESRLTVRVLGGGGHGLCLPLLLRSAPPASNQWARRMQGIPVAYGQNESQFADR